MPNPSSPPTTSQPEPLTIITARAALRQIQSLALELEIPISSLTQPSNSHPLLRQFVRVQQKSYSNQEIIASLLWVMQELQMDLDKHLDPLAQDLSSFMISEQKSLKDWIISTLESAAAE